MSYLTQPFDVLSIVILFSTLLVGTYLFKIYTHPLRNVPGPFLAKFTNARFLYYAWNGNLHLDHVQCHARYGCLSCSDQEAWRTNTILGPVYRCAPNRVVFNSLTAANAIYSNDRRIRKSDGYTSHPWTRQETPSLFNCVDPVWANRKKKTLRPATSQPALELHQESVNENVETLAAMFKDGQQQDLSEIGFHYALDVISQSVFGENFKTLQDPTNRWMTASLERGNRHMYLQLAWPTLFHILGLFIRVEVLSYPEFFKESKMFLDLCERCIVQGSAKMKSSILQLMKAELPEEVSDDELRVDAYSFMRGGGDMVAVTIAATFFYIRQNPQILQKLQHEIRTTFGSQTPTSSPKLDSCTYLRACVDEALRMAPPGPGVFWRTSSSHHVIDGIALPPGTEFGVCIYALHYNNTMFNEPETYKPERMIKTDTAEVSAREGLISFLRGFRACPAQKLAYATILLPIARLVWEFDLDAGEPASASEMTPQHTKVFPQVDVFGSNISGPVISFNAKHE
ncbi:cytochrome P450 [Paraphoma chrysanthemicola]|uniref:Cytochrome P450 n=1 Tax=Paraphoma chrysanthemicola TaxID=798071 RepID=A0A8K0R3K9_9PLEO|nr:cytochrome P450 [Paraphoma chrysanthemicola]